jgi:hypothetical protein
MSLVVAQSQVRREALLQLRGAQHANQSPNTQPQSVLTRMRSFLNLIHH